MTDHRFDDGRRPHRYPKPTDPDFPYESVMAWKCDACGEWVPEYGTATATECPIDWRNQ